VAVSGFEALVVANASAAMPMFASAGNLAGEELPVWGVDSDALEAIIQFFTLENAHWHFLAIAVLDAATRLDVPALANAAEAFVRARSHQTPSLLPLRRAFSSE